MFRRFSQIALSLALSVLPLGAPVLSADLDQEVVLDIPAQSLEFALLKLSEQSGVQIQMASSDVPEFQVAALSGRMPVSKALAALLNRTGLSYQIVGESTVAIYRDRGAGNTRRLRTDTLMASNAPAALPASASARGEPAVALEEVVVTAQKREEKMQDVPISITALSGEQIENRGVSGLADLNALAPNVMFRQSPGARLISVVSIRGSAMGQPAIWVDPPVGLYLNGIYLGKSQGSVFDIVDIERVEVLRGPQGTLFGRNTEGGAINFITRKPSGEFSGKAGVEFGNFDHKAAKFNVDLPRFGIASVSLGARKMERDGWAKNLAGPDLGAIDSEAARASVKLDFTDDFNAVYEFDYSNIDNTPVAVTLFALDGWRGTFPSLFGPALGTAIQDALAPYVTTKRPDTVSVSGPGPLFERGKTDAHALTLTWQASDRDEFKYIFARRSLSFTNGQDQDASPVDSVTLAPGATRSIVAYNNRTTDYDQDSHELQWSSDRGRLRHVLGLYYFDDDGETNGAQNFALLGASPQRADYASGTRAWAVFGQADFALTDRWTATLGVRYTEEEKRGWSHRYLTDGFDGPRTTDLLPYIAYSEDFSDTTPMAALSFKPTGDLNFYGRVAKGFKSGGFSSEVADPRVTTPYQPQTSVSTEIGMKSTLLGGRARFNLALYNTDISDQQTTQLLPGTTQSLMVNAGESTYRGVEIEVAMMITEGWQVQLGYGYLDAEYDKFIDNAFLPPLVPGGPIRTGGPLIDTAGNRLPSYAPEHTLNLTLDGSLLRTRWGELRAILDATYVSKTHLYAVNKSLTAPNAGGSNLVGINTMPAQKNLNARLLLADIPAGPGTVDLSFWGRNLTDEDEMLAGIDFSMFRNTAWQEPRTYMFTATYKW